MKQKKTIVLIIFCLFAGIIFLACPLFPPEREITGTLNLTLGQDSLARVIQPENVQALVSLYDITLSRSGHGDVTISDTPETSHTIPDLVVGTWSVLVSAKNSEGAEIGRGSGNINITEAGPNNLTVNLFLLATATGDVHVTLLWPDSAGIDQVRFKTKPLGGSFSSWADMTIVNDAGEYSSAVYQDTDVAAGSYMIIFEFLKNSVLQATAAESINTFNNLVSSGTISLAPEDFNTPPAGVTSFSAADGELKNILLSWDASAVITETGFVVERSLSSDFSEAVTFNINTVNTETYNDTTVNIHTDYYYRIAAVNSFGSSPWTELAGPAASHVNTFAGSVNASSNAGAAAMSNYTKITGYLSISGSVTDLSGLSNITEIGGDLTLSGLPLTNFSGLDNLTSVGSYVNIYNCDALTDLSGLSGLQTVGGYFQIKYCDGSSFTDLTGLTNLVSIGGALILDSNTYITDLTGLTSLSTLGSLKVIYNPALSSLSGLPAGLTTLQGDLLINDNDNAGFTSLAGLENLVSITGFVEITNNQNLSNFAGLDNLEGVGKNIYASSNPSLSTMILPSLLSIGINPDNNNNGLTMYDNGGMPLTEVSMPLLQSIEGLVRFRYMNNLETLNFPSLNTVGLFFWIDQCPVLSTVDCTSLASVGGNFTINYAPLLTTLAGLPALETVGGILDISSTGISNVDPWAASLKSVNGIIIYNNQALTSLAGLEGLGSVTPLEMSGDLIINNNDNITFKNLPDLSGIREIQGSLKIYDNNYIQDLGNFSGLEYIGAELFIYANYALQNLNNLGNVNFTSIGTNLTLQDNSVLTSISSLGSLMSVGGSIMIYNNDQLQHLTGLEGIQTVGGSIFIGVDGGGTGYDNNSLQSANFTALTSLGSSLRLYGTNLTTIDFSQLTSIPGQLYITYTALSNLDTFANLTTLHSFLKISNNSQLADLDGLSSLTTIGSYVEIYNNPGLLNIHGLANVETISGTLTISANNNTLFNDLFGPGAALSTVGGTIYISSNTNLTSLAGLEGLTTSYSIDLYTLANLTDISALGNLTIISGYVSFSNLDGLTTLSGVSSLQTVTGNLTITGCDNLTDIGIPPEPLSVNSLSIHNNPALSLSSVIQPWIDALNNIVSPGSNYIANNAP